LYFTLTYPVNGRSHGQPILPFEKKIKLISHLKQGDSHAFTVIFNGYGRKLYRFAYGFLNLGKKPKKWWQDTFVRLWENREKTGRKRPRWGGYLFRITYPAGCSTASAGHHAKNNWPCISRPKPPPCKTPPRTKWPAKK
jgi:hypothetical protein